MSVECCIWHLAVTTSRPTTTADCTVFHCSLFSRHHDFISRNLLSWRKGVARSRSLVGEQTRSHTHFCHSKPQIGPQEKLQHPEYNWRHNWKRVLALLQSGHILPFKKTLIHHQHVNIFTNKHPAKSWSRQTQPLRDVSDFCDRWQHSLRTLSH